ncbi:MAG: 4-hydroxythreonine-4-phosphate dehydrogenase PdxA [Burkholderiales bacterium]
MPPSPHSVTVALTAGEPAGIGPDLCVLLAQRRLLGNVVVVASRTLLEQRAQRLGIALNILDFGAAGSTDGAVLRVWNHDLYAPVVPGRLDVRNCRYVIETLHCAVRGCLEGRFNAMATGPVHKDIINQAGIPFYGHTEFLAQETSSEHVVMMLIGGGMRVALATTHLALRDVASTITRDNLTRTLRVLGRELVDKFGVIYPRILVAGINPHAGEGGLLGREEIEVVIPVLEQLRKEGMALSGPLPADTLFQPRLLKDADCVLAMYHDQGLPVLKYASFGSGINITLGLPIIRTSVDHGTALELAGSADIECGSMIAALDLAATLAQRAGQAAGAVT